MSLTPDFLDSGRPDVPDLVVSRGVLPFFLPRRPVRGRLVRLGRLADALLTRHAHPACVTELAGQALALAAGLASALKFRGSFSIQVRGDGPVSMLVTDCTEAGELRFYVRCDREKLAALLLDGPEPSAAALLGTGYFAFTVDQGPDMERHQGIVSIEGTTLGEMALHYFRTSEQLRCFVHLAAAQGPEGWRAGALVLERVAGAGGVAAAGDDPADDDAAFADGGFGDREADEEAWRSAVTLAETLTDAELLDDALAPEEVVWRLFGNEGVAVDRPRALAYGCRCSRARLNEILESFSTDDLDHMSVAGDIVMTCEFCNIDFRFARAESGGRGQVSVVRTGEVGAVALITDP